jgi:hypothetical protein
MLSETEPRPMPTPESALRTLRILTVSMAIGPLLLAAIAYATRRGAPPPRPPIPDLIVTILVVTWVGAAMVLPGVIASNQARAVTDRRPESREPKGEALEASRNALAGVYLVRGIIRSALLEGASFFLMVSYLIGGPAWELILGVVLAGGVAVGFPTRGGIEGWIEARLDEARERGMLA